jgi:hypothetical protein
MSTIPMVVAHEAPNGRLCRFKPMLRGAEKEVRSLSVEKGLHEWLYAEQGLDMPRQKANIRAHLGEFVRGEHIDDLEYMKRVEDHRNPSGLFAGGIWSIRPRFRPQYRLFGMFVITNWFVLLNQQNRDYLGESNEKWLAETRKCNKLWTELFPGRSPWISDDLGDFVSSNMEKCDDRW